MSRHLNRLADQLIYQLSDQHVNRRPDLRGLHRDNHHHSLRGSRQLSPRDSRHLDLFWLHHQDLQPNLLCSLQLNRPLNQLTSRAPDLRTSPLVSLVHSQL